VIFLVKFSDFFPTQRARSKLYFGGKSNFFVEIRSKNWLRRFLRLPYFAQKIGSKNDEDLCFWKRIF